MFKVPCQQESGRSLESVKVIKVYFIESWWHRMKLWSLTLYYGAEIPFSRRWKGWLIQMRVWRIVLIRAESEGQVGACRLWDFRLGRNGMSTWPLELHKPFKFTYLGLYGAHQYVAELKHSLCFICFIDVINKHGTKVLTKFSMWNCCLLCCDNSACRHKSYCWFYYLPLMPIFFFSFCFFVFPPSPFSFFWHTPGVFVLFSVRHLVPIHYHLLGKCLISIGPESV